MAAVNSSRLPNTLQFYKSFQGHRQNSTGGKNNPEMSCSSWGVISVVRCQVAIGENQRQFFPVSIFNLSVFISLFLILAVFRIQETTKQI